jgi:lysophospholipase L1-like esterase
LNDTADVARIDDDVPPGRRRVLTFLLAAASTLVALGMGEVAVRLAGLAPAVARIELQDDRSPYQVSDSPILAYELKPDFVDPVRPGFRTNSGRLWGPERAIPKPPGVFRIALVGDSVVEGYGLERGEDTIGSRLQEILRGPFEVLSAGVCGYNTRAEVELVRRRVLRYQPDLVVIVFVSNDYRQANGNLDLAGRYPRPRWAERLLATSHLLRFAAFRLNWSHYREEADPLYLEQRHRETGTKNNVEVGLGELASLSRRHGFHTAIAVWPDFRDTIDEAPGFREDTHPDRLRVEVVAARYDIPLVRLGRAFVEDYARRRDPPPPGELYTTDGMHPNAAGTRIAALALGQLLAERGLLGAPGAAPLP